MDKHEMNFARYIRFGLAAVVFVLSSCSSKPTQTAVIITKTPEATATATIEPTATIAPKPDYITEGNSVETDDGTVFVKDGKYMLYDLKTGEIREIKDISTAVVFNNRADAAIVVRQMYKDEFDNQDAINFYPGNLSSWDTYEQAVESISNTSRDSQGYAIVPGYAIEGVKVKSATGSVDNPTDAVIFMNVPDSKISFPHTVGVFDKRGTLSLLYSGVRVRPASSYADKVEEHISPSIGWEGFQRMVVGNIMMVNVLVTIPEGKDDHYIPTLVTSTLSLEIQALKLELLSMQEPQAKAGFIYIGTEGSLIQTGALVEAIITETPNGGVFVSEYDNFTVVDINK